MIKARLTNPITGGPVLIFGFSDENLKRLRAGKPIKVDLRDLGPGLPPVPMFFMAGRDEESMRAQLAEHFTMPGEEGP